MFVCLRNVGRIRNLIQSIIYIREFLTGIRELRDALTLQRSVLRQDMVRTAGLRALETLAVLIYQDRFSFIGVFVRAIEINLRWLESKLRRCMICIEGDLGVRGTTFRLLLHVSLYGEGTSLAGGREKNLRTLWILKINFLKKRWKILITCWIHNFKMDGRWRKKFKNELGKELDKMARRNKKGIIQLQDKMWEGFQKGFHNQEIGKMCCELEAVKEVLTNVESIVYEIDPKLEEIVRNEGEFIPVNPTSEYSQENNSDEPDRRDTGTVDEEVMCDTNGDENVPERGLNSYIEYFEKDVYPGVSRKIVFQDES
jgi:hypothetical protein